MVVGIDPATDLALLKIAAKDLPAMPWGDSSKLKVAEWVLAIGNPYQLNQTVTLGIVSALGRTNLGVSSYEDFIQTDAAINPGNSGGALINSHGELIGINTVIFSQSGGYQGIGFAVSSNLAKRVVNDLQQYQEVRRGSIGPIEIVPLTTRIANELDLQDTKGALVYQLGRNSPAFKAGMKPADVVVSFNGTMVEDPGHLSRLVSDAKIGSTATIGVIRQGRRVDLKVDISRLSAR
jgi:serine protease Do